MRGAEDGREGGQKRLIECNSDETVTCRGATYAQNNMLIN